MEKVMLEYREMTKFNFTEMIQKLASVKTNNVAACHIHQVVKRLKAMQKTVVAEFQSDIVEKFAKRTADGVIDRSSQPDDPHHFDIIEGKEEEMKKAQEEFGLRKFHMDFRPLTPSVLKDMVLSANDIETLGPLFTEHEGPGVPHLVK